MYIYIYIFIGLYFGRDYTCTDNGIKKLKLNNTAKTFAQQFFT